MDSPNNKAKKLIALAMDPAASLEEARTAAYAAVRLIHHHGLLTECLNQVEQEEPEPEPQEGPRQLTRAELRILVEKKVNRFLAYLFRKSSLDEYPRVTIRYLTEKSMRNGEIHANDRHVYAYYLRSALKEKVHSGILSVRGGYGGGYALATKQEKRVA